MTRARGIIDRLRIERLVWALDQQLYDLPRRTRIATRREVRTNLVDAAREIGTSAALQRIGSSRQLAEQYLTAELGDGPRHSWVAAAYFAATAPLLLTFFLSEAALAYQHGLTAAHASGRFFWSGVAYLQSAQTFTVDHGQVSSTAGAWTPPTYLLWIAGTIACGRLWRLLPALRRRHTAPV
jgi:hypothetical protein